MYSLFTSSWETSPSGENIDAFQSAPLATITDAAPYITHQFHLVTKHEKIFNK